MSARRSAGLCAGVLAVLALASGSACAAGGPGGGGGGGQGPQARGRGGGGGGGGQQGSGQRGGTGQAGMGGGGGSPQGYGSARGPGGQEQYQRGSQDQNQYQFGRRSRERARSGGDAGEQRRSRNRWEYEREKEFRFRGVVVEGPGQQRQVEARNTLRVRTEAGEERGVELGPPWFTEGLDLSPRAGETVEIVGAAHGSANSEVIARELSWRGNTYRLRLENGAPVWAGAGRAEWSAYASSRGGGAQQEIEGEIEGIRGIAPGGPDMGQGVVLRIRTRERERARVHLGPYWHVEEGLPGLRIGQRVRVSGWPARVGSEDVVVASEVQREQQRLRLRTGEGRPAWSGGWQNWDGWGPGSSYARMYDPARVRTVTGVVERVGEGVPLRGMGKGLMLTIRTRERERARVHLGPVWFAEQADLMPEPGAQVTVTGAAVDMNGAEVIVAGEFQSGERRVRLRERDGTPVWAGRGPGEPQESHLRRGD